MTAAVRAALPASLSLLADAPREITVSLEGPVTQQKILDAIEARYPMLRGTIRDQVTGRRRPFIRFFACQQDFSHVSADAPLPGLVAEGREVFLVVGAIAGG